MLINEADNHLIYPSEINRSLQPVPAVMSEPDLNTLLGQVYIGDKSLVGLLQDAMQVESDTFHQETFLIDGKYYVIKIDEITIDGKNEKIGNIVEVDGVWYLAKMAYDDDKVFIGWTPIMTMPLNVAEASGFVTIGETPTPVPVPTVTTGIENDNEQIIIKLPSIERFIEDYKFVIIIAIILIILNFPFYKPKIFMSIVESLVKRFIP